MPEIVARLLAFIGPLLPGFFVGFFLGRLARKAFGTALSIAAGLVAILFLAGHFGADLSIVSDFLNWASSWAGDTLTGIKQYLAAILPTAAAVGVGFKVGLGRG
jgi:hypothetical protein